MSETIRDLGDGLILRTADPEDAEELAAFNVRLHSDDLAEPDQGLGHWTRELLSGRHPTTGAEDFTVVTNAEGKIVSAAVLISQRWRYEDVEFGVGRPELIATQRDNRRRGLVREQMEVLHAWSAERGELVQAITGIPWYYRQFGYEMALDLGGGQRFFWSRIGNLQKVKQEAFRMRAATVDDIPVLLELIAFLAERSMVSCGRDEELLRWEIEGGTKGTPGSRYYHVIEDEQGVVGFADVVRWPPSLAVRQFAVHPDRSLRAVALFLTRELHRIAEKENPGAKKKFGYAYFGLGPSDPVYDALDGQLEDAKPPYAWYVRVSDLAGFLERLSPVLSRRLADSVMAGHRGKLRLNFYTDRIHLSFEGGKLRVIEDWKPERLADGDGLFPDLTFLSLLFGRRNMRELNAARADCYATDAEAEVLLDILFPKKTSHVLPLA